MWRGREVQVRFKRFKELGDDKAGEHILKASRYQAVCDLGLAWYVLLSNV
jgi:hypothetical protein